MLPILMLAVSGVGHLGRVANLPLHQDTKTAAKRPHVILSVDDLVDVHVSDEGLQNPRHVIGKGLRVEDEGAQRGRHLHHASGASTDVLDVGQTILLVQGVDVCV